MSSPCQMCYVHGRIYSKENCESCEFEIAMNCLKKILQVNDGCLPHCKHSYYTRYPGFAGWECDKQENECEHHSMYEIDFEKLQKDYKL